MPLGQGASQGGPFLICSRFNHSCVANAQYFYSETSKKENVFATKDIQKGDEITVCYLSDDIWRMPRDQRRAAILKEFHFLCQCQVCAKRKQKNVAKSDRRRQRQAELDETTEDGKTIIQNPKKLLSYCKEALDVLRLLGESELRLRASTVYYDASKICAVNSNFAASNFFAGRAVDVRMDWQGRNAVGLGRYLEVVLNPHAHYNAGQTTLLKKDGEAFEEMCAKETTDEEKEAWLWKQYATAEAGTKYAVAQSKRK